MFKHPRFANVWSQIKQVIFLHLVVCRGSETQLQVDENLNSITPELVLLLDIFNSYWYTAVQSRKAVSVYFTGKQTLFFGFAERHRALLICIMYIFLPRDHERVSEFHL